MDLYGLSPKSLPIVGPGDYKDFKLTKNIKTINGSQLSLHLKLKQGKLPLLYLGPLPSFLQSKKQKA